MPEQNPHYFYALEIPLETKGKLQMLLMKLKETCPFKRWVHHQDLHITLAFLGNADEEKLTESITRLESGVRPPPFSLTIDHLGIFGKEDSPRIFWAGVNSQPLLSNARDIVYEACLASGFELETRPFKPHITLARKWAGEFPFTRKILENRNPFLEDPLTFWAENIVLYKTLLGKEPKYEPVSRLTLKKNER